MCDKEKDKEKELEKDVERECYIVNEKYFSPLTYFEYLMFNFGWNISAKEETWANWQRDQFLKKEYGIHKNLKIECLHCNRKFTGEDVKLVSFEAEEDDGTRKIGAFCPNYEICKGSRVDFRFD